MTRPRLEALCRRVGRAAVAAEPYIRTAREGYRAAHRERDKQTLVVAWGGAEREIEQLGLSPQARVFNTNAGHCRWPEGLLLDRVIWVEDWEQGFLALDVRREVDQLAARRPGGVEHVTYKPGRAQ